MSNDYSTGQTHVNSGGSSTDFVSGSDAWVGAYRAETQRMVAMHFPNTSSPASAGSSSSSSSSSSGSSSGSGCFVATACFEDADHPTVDKLREFRDRRLVHSAVGRLFIRTYEEVGPPAAGFVIKHPRIKPALRRALTFISHLLPSSRSSMQPR